jgi:manganese/zinc/iron transport system permease protein
MILSMDAQIVLTGVMVGLAAVPLGLFLVLRGAAMLTDAISHTVVLGIALVWLATGQTTGPVQMAGAALTGVATVLAIAALERSRLVTMDAATGLVFSAMFALGVLLLNLHARNVHLDADTVLLGEIGLVWLRTVSLGGVEVALSAVTLAVMAAINAVFVGAFWKELRLASFDPALAGALGFAPGLLGLGLLALTSATAVAAFDAVGVILFIALTVVPPATALLLTRRLGLALGFALGLSALSAVAGHGLALVWDVSISGMMTSVSGLVFVLALLLAPRRGVLAYLARRRAERLENDCRALVAHLQTHQTSPEARVEAAAPALVEHLRWSPARAERVLLASLDRGLVRREGVMLHLTEKGQAEARAIFAPWARGIGM